MYHVFIPYIVVRLEGSRHRGPGGRCRPQRSPPAPGSAAFRRGTLQRQLLEVTAGRVGQARLSVLRRRVRCGCLERPDASSTGARKGAQQRVGAEGDARRAGGPDSLHD